MQDPYTTRFSPFVVVVGVVVDGLYGPVCQLFPACEISLLSFSAVGGVSLFPESFSQSFLFPPFCGLELVVLAAGRPVGNGNLNALLRLAGKFRPYKRKKNGEEEIERKWTGSIAGHDCAGERKAFGGGCPSLSLQLLAIAGEIWVPKRHWKGGAEHLFGEAVTSLRE